MFTACCHNNAYCYIDKPAIVSHKKPFNIQVPYTLRQYKGNFGKVEKVNINIVFYVKQCYIIYVVMNCSDKSTISCITTHKDIRAWCCPFYLLTLKTTWNRLKNNYKIRIGLMSKKRVFICGNRLRPSNLKPTCCHT